MTKPKEMDPNGTRVILEIRANCPDCGGTHRNLQITVPVPDELRPISCPLCKRTLFCISG